MRHSTNTYLTAVNYSKIKYNTFIVFKVVLSNTKLYVLNIYTKCPIM